MAPLSNLSFVLGVSFAYNNDMNRISESQVNEIRSLRDSGLSYAAIGRKIGCSDKTASYYVNIEREQKIKNEYYENNKDDILAKRKLHDPIFYIENRERILETKKRYYIANRDPNRSYDWTLRSKNHIRFSHRKSLERQCEYIGHKYTDITIKWLRSLWYKTDICVCCNVLMDEKFCRRPESKSIDHIMPLNINGFHVMNNIRIICLKCNISRPWDGRDIL